ncbi:MAG TPA: hypothetical protein VFS90_20205 [Pyrinomonadaceae bacterium]|nr:hypothetical protein [Pyrinomonadaceae bacterium]
MNREYSHCAKIFVLAAFILLTTASVHAQSITIVSPKGSTEANPLTSTGGSRMQLKFKVGDPALTDVHIVAYSVTGAKEGDFKLEGAGDQKVTLSLLRGKNKITLFGYSGAPSSITEKSPSANLFINCNDDDCGAKEDLIVKEKGQVKEPGGGGGGGGGGTGGDGKSEANIAIEFLKTPVTESPAETVITSKGKATKLTVVVYDAKDNTIDRQEIELKPYKDLKIAFTKLKITKDQNIIRVYDPANPGDKTNELLALVNCSGDKCTAPTVDKPAPATKLITIENPTSPAKASDSFGHAFLSVKNLSAGRINKIKYFVIHNGKTVVNADEVDEIPVNYEGDKPAKVTVPIKYVEGDNAVIFYDIDKPLDETRQAVLLINCEGAKCVDNFLVAQFPSNSINTRVVVGMEQVGASSAESETKPFLDFFFTNSILFDTLKRKGLKAETINGKKVWVPYEAIAVGPDEKPIRVPRFGTWGLIRFSTTPQQIAGASVFPSNFVNQVTDPSEVVDLVQSFDFIAGVEGRVFSANGWNWTLVPGIKQQSRFYLTFGAGAISPLNPTRTSAQIFKIPGEDSPQRADFVKRFGEPPENKTYVGFVPLERDRFFRQYYLGFRLKSHFCENSECTRFKNSFPSVVDLAFGQNEAVTGGTFRQDGKRSWVVRLDAFYPFPLRAANFLYLYGSAVFKIGQGGPRIDVPLFLDTAPGEIQITNDTVFIPPPEQQPSRLNRDYYKIGVGVNLTDLFNRNKTPRDN